MRDIIIARVLHVVAVVIWIGGLSMLTTTALPAILRGDLGEDRLRAFEAIERRFVWQARSAVLLAGLSGLYMTWRLDLWDRFRVPTFWWMHAMVCLWLLFAVMLFIAEPLILSRKLRRRAAVQPRATFTRMYRAHWVLLALSIMTIVGAVAGAQGWSIF
jgi:uncharacterized membrane protein